MAKQSYSANVLTSSSLLDTFLNCFCRCCSWCAPLSIQSHIDFRYLKLKFHTKRIRTHLKKTSNCEKNTFLSTEFDWWIWKAWHDRFSGFFCFVLFVNAIKERNSCGEIWNSMTDKLESHVTSTNSTNVEKWSWTIWFVYIAIVFWW